MGLADITPALAELQDAFARVKAQAQVLRLALRGLSEGTPHESDIRVLLCHLASIEEELQQSEGFLNGRQH